MKKSKYLFDRFEFTEKYKNEVLKLIKGMTNLEFGGDNLYNGMKTHFCQNPYELTDYIFSIKKFEINNKIKFDSYLEVGLSSGITNTLFHKFFKFKNMVAIDICSADINGSVLAANLRHKDLILFCSNSHNQSTIENVSKFSPYDLIFIDAGHEYDDVKKDFYNYFPQLSEKGVIAFHDAKCQNWPGIEKFLDELRNTNLYNMHTIFEDGYYTNYGIEIITKKNNILKI